VAAQAYDKRTNVGGSLLQITGYDDGSYDLFDSGGAKVGSGSASTGGKVEFTSTNNESLYGGASRTIESFNVSNLNANLDKDKLSSIAAAGYGNQMNIDGVTVPISETAANAGASLAGGNSGTDPGATTTTSSGTSPDTPKPVGGTTANNYRYPYDRMSTQDHVLFSRIRYVSGGTSALATGAIGRPSERLAAASVLGTTILPIPTNVSSDVTVGWGDDRLDFVKAMMGAGAEGLIAGGDTLDTVLNNISGTVSANKESLKQLLQKSVAGSIAGSNLFTRTTGAVTNNNLELLFTGPELRGFNFTYRLTPRDSTETAQIKGMIRQFKQSMAASVVDGQLFLQTPNVYKIEFFYRGTAHPFLDRIKPCALTNFKVNYTPDNAYMTYGDGSPISYEISLGFKELEPIYAQDYDVSEGLLGMGY